MNFLLLDKVFISWWQAIVLGIVQGLGEFLPISSSGHLSLFENILSLPDVPRVFDVCLHIGTLVATFIVFKDEIIDIIKHPLQKMTYLIVAATAVTVVIAVAIEFIGDKVIGEDIMNSMLGFNFMITGSLLLLMESLPKRKNTKDLDTMTYKDALTIGAMQGVGTLSGISRSGSTIATGSMLGLNRKFLSRFAFLMSIPSVIGAFCWDTLKFIIKGNDGIVQISILPVILGSVAAFIVGYIAVRWMLKLIANKSFIPFAIYTFSLGLLVTLDTFFLHIVF